MPSLGIHLSNYLCNQQFRSFPLSIKERPNRWRLSCERLLAGRKEPCSVQRRSTAQRTNERFHPAALGSFKRWLGGAASHAAPETPGADRPISGSPRGRSASGSRRERWALEHARPVLDELDAAVEG